ncbi:AbrB family transcriptional regulator [Streptomyces glebosus]|uniref:AbrB family transcriptional regulator n=1 Tax=Streptomyces glebosus TaxID=249580 RepID=A0A640SQ99_9ACTN|nr:AbrB family transcriptional regulator [Streptomyces glebosus]GFE13268.1 AbrB family transcriptional regulator [Streptomyces glebosus]GHG66709.1 AbrB family transcriptional regulator [Streptomyces glebosus]
MAPTSALQREHPPSPGTATKPAPHPTELRRFRPASVGRWALISAGAYAAGLAASAFGVPAPYLLCALLVGAVLALTGVVRERVPAPANRVSQALVGALMGSYLTWPALASAAPVALPLTAVTAATIALSVAVAWLLARGRQVSRPSAVLGMVPGGSAAIVTCADELKADVRLVAFTQYLRVGLVATTAPLVAQWLASAASAGSPGQAGDGGSGTGLLPLVTGSGQLAGLLTLAAVSVAGVLAGRRLRLPTPALIGPMLAALVATLSNALPGFAPAGLLQNLVFVFVGLDVGVRFTRETLVRVRRLLPSILLAIATVCAGCVLLAWLFATVTGTPVIDAYLATTPGGINAVLATAVSSHADVALISTVQSLRLLIVVLVTPMITRWLTAGRPAVVDRVVAGTARG